MRLPVNHALPLLLIAGVIGGTGAYAKSREPALPTNGPAADYPMVLGEPLLIGGTTYTPEDRLNYDAVGYAEIGTNGGPAISAAHKTLPLPSYVEVTSLESGRTILVRIERRGPLNERLIELSPGAAAQLGLMGIARPTVRVRRVNPPEQERALLRAGGPAPERMATPRGLLDALNRKLNGSSAVLSAKPEVQPVVTPAPRLAVTPSTAPQPRSAAAPLHKPAAAPVPKPMKAPLAVAAPAPAPAARAAGQGSLVVQVAALSTPDRANALAGRLGARATSTGKLWRVRMGPYATRAEAEAALAKARGAGYSDARIQRAD